MELAVALPTRGLIHSRTIEAVIQAIEHRGIREYTLVLTHDLPIPDSHETVCKQALATGAEFIWLVEEDVVPLELLTWGRKDCDQGCHQIAWRPRPTRQLGGM